MYDELMIYCYRPTTFGFCVITGLILIYTELVQVSPRPLLKETSVGTVARNGYNYEYVHREP